MESFVRGVRIHLDGESAAHDAAADLWEVSERLPTKSFCDGIDGVFLTNHKPVHLAPAGWRAGHQLLFLQPRTYDAAVPDGAARQLRARLREVRLARYQLETACGVTPATCAIS